MKPTSNKYRPPHTNHGNRRDTVQAYLNEIGQIPILSPGEEIALVKLAQQGNKEAADKLIQSNLRFVVQVACEYQDRGLPLADLISEGNMGLMRALRTFDPNKGYKFITYAVWWIRQHIRQALSTISRTVRLPGNRLSEMQRFRGAAKRLEQKLQRLPTVGEVEAALGANWNGFITSTEFLHSQHALGAAPSHDAAKRLLNVLPNEDSKAPDDELRYESLRRELEDALKILDKRERMIVLLLFGLEGQRPLKLGEAGALFGLSRERVRQIRNRSLEKLRRSKQITNPLREYL